MRGFEGGKDDEKDREVRAEDIQAKTGGKDFPEDEGTGTIPTHPLGFSPSLPDSREGERKDKKRSVLRRGHF